MTQKKQTFIIKVAVTTELVGNKSVACYRNCNERKTATDCEIHNPKQSVTEIEVDDWARDIFHGCDLGRVTVLGVEELKDAPTIERYEQTPRNEMFIKMPSLLDMMKEYTPELLPAFPPDYSAELIKPTITPAMLQNAKDGDILAVGLTIDDEEHCHLNRTGKEIQFVAVAGMCGDWAMYYGLTTFDVSEIKKHGDKMITRETVAACVYFTDEIWKKYRL